VLRTNMINGKMNHESWIMRAVAFGKLYTNYSQVTLTRVIY